MLAVYDLECNPPTYDVVAFLALLEVERLRRGEEHIDLHILPGPIGGFRHDGLWPRSIEQRVAIRRNILVPICRLLPSIRSVTVQPTRVVPVGDEFGFRVRKISLPAIVEAMKHDSRPLRGAKAIHGHRVEERLITLTLREADHWPLRNSKTREWIEAAIALEGLGYQVIVIRDTCQADKPIASVKTSPLASKNLNHRASLYMEAVLNVGISNGPMWMALFMDVPTLMLRPVTEAAHGYNASFFKRCGLPKDTQLANSPSYQRLAWVDDTCENIVNEIGEMLCVIG